MRRLGVIILLLSALTPASAQGKLATVLEDEATFTMQSLENGTLSVRRTVTVHSKTGLGAADFMVYTDKNVTLTSFSGSFTAPNGKQTSVKKKDLTTVSVASGIAEDGFINVYSPSPASYPFTITYEYSVQHRKGFAVFPHYAPVDTEETDLKSGKYTLIVPCGTAVHYYATAPAGECRLTQGAKADTYEWSIKDFPGITKEDYMPSIHPMIPMVLASPDVFSFEGRKGMQDSWESLGAWYYGLLAEVPGLPEGSIGKVREMTSGAKDELGKIRVLYDYLREKTRYVSIQFGIGGYKPFPPSTVEKAGFGDCKALSNYMRCLLSAVGIESEYTILDTDASDFRPGYASFGQTDHVMLTVPLKELCDTLYLECTNPSLPLGYRHDNVAGHQVLRLGPGGGTLSRVAAYPDSIRRTETKVEIKLESEGKASITLNQHLRGDRIEPWVRFRELDADGQRRLMTSALSGQPQNFSVLAFTDNFNSYDGRTWIPECDARCRFDILTFGKWNGTRMVVAANPVSKKMSSQRSERIHPLEIRDAACYDDEVSIEIPAGLVVESLPQDVSLEGPWGTFTSKAEDLGGRVVIRQIVQLTPCSLPRESYSDFRDFVRSLNRAYSANVVLKKAD